MCNNEDNLFSLIFQPKTPFFLPLRCLCIEKTETICNIIIFLCRPALSLSLAATWILSLGFYNAHIKAVIISLGRKNFRKIKKTEIKKCIFFKQQKRREKRVHSWLLPRTWKILLFFFSFDFLSSLKPKLETRLSISISQFFSSWHGSLTIIIHSLGTPEQRPEIEKRVSERKKLIKKAEHLLHHIVYPI